MKYVTNTRVEINRRRHSDYTFVLELSMTVHTINFTDDKKLIIEWR